MRKVMSQATIEGSNLAFFFLFESGKLFSQTSCESYSLTLADSLVLLLSHGTRG